MSAFTGFSHLGVRNMENSSDISATLALLMTQPSLALARQLEQQLTNTEHRKIVFGGRINQKASIEAASEGDRGAVERLANAFDASLTAARVMSGMKNSDSSLTPRRAAQRFLNPNQDTCEWNSPNPKINFEMPVVQFWPEVETKRRFKRFQSTSGLCSLLIRDNSLGICREDLPKTILALNSESKLRTWEAIGQFGHGGSSALAFCESSLIVTQPRSGGTAKEFYWTLIIPELESSESKQSIVLKWFADKDGLPLIGRVSDYSDLGGALPGTSVWHFGYDRGDWVKTAVGTHQDTPAGRLGRLLFSYPLPFKIQGELARGDTGTGSRTIKGAFFRLIDDRGGTKSSVEYRSGEKSEELIVDGVTCGYFSIFAFVLSPTAEVRNYVEQDRPVVLTLHGQNHGEIRRTMLFETGFTELASSMIVEIRLDALDGEAQSEIITNSRETPKNTRALKALKQRVIELLKNDEELATIDRRRQEERAKKSSSDLSKRITTFLSSIISDAKAMPGTLPGTGGLGGNGNVGPGPQRPEIPASDPPKVLEFLGTGPLFVAEGTALLVKFGSDARPPKYSFHGDNPRCFVRLDTSDEFKDRLTLTGKSDINGRGYGSITLTAAESDANPTVEDTVAGTLFVTIQAADGRILEKSLPVGLRPKPQIRKRKPRQAVVLEIRFCAPSSVDIDEVKRIVGEEEIGDFSPSYLGRYRDALQVTDMECAYWGEKSESSGISKLVVEINTAYLHFKQLFQSISTIEEKIKTKESIVQDIVLDCYQHSFRLEDMPEGVHEQVFTDPDDAKRAAEICLNFDKALRLLEREKSVKNRPQ